MGSHFSFYEVTFVGELFRAKAITACPPVY